ncbi:hypothetical protein NPA07_02000 [Mycoplasmopsis caviae]|uniref:Uncharacterized protein n=1 Tax=Mycoplasmopsis caviae TaxID=55603 RepID=A0ABY5IZP9_9BACT|nr:hypothetical protein [Mycoplasmopsis caviae]UUD35622.1 hypothetical protein NPA07_02000 [Mycoplasmopsis caviae]
MQFICNEKSKKWVKRRRMFLENGQDISKIEAQFIKIYEKILNKNPLKVFTKIKVLTMILGKLLKLMQHHFIFLEKVRSTIFIILLMRQQKVC